MTKAALPQIDITPLFAGPSAARDAVDAAIMSAASDFGFLTITGLPDNCLDPDLRKRMLSIFDLEDGAKRALTRQSFAPENSNVYRGWFPLQDGHPTYKEGIDIGADLNDPSRPVDPTDPLTEHTPLPDLPEWRAAVRTYYGAMSRTGQALMRSFARGLDLPENQFDAAFAQESSTLRLIHYPPRTPESFGADRASLEVQYAGETRYLLGKAHVDSGFVTLLAQDGVEGLQAQVGEDWAMVPPHEGALAVNFGKLLHRWTGGAIKATVHRVIGQGTRRFSIPFFYEPGVDAVIAPLPGVGGDFEPVSYGDHLWEATTSFVEQKGIAHLRAPRGLS
ncbi:2OG-Fe(II) oxygenase family protein [uncultured Tateyamaria sp.]|uniref:isopenicillin N synthase family dioxygenase n=1 Tax=uncultured Tateyamaria sp. TaxID=455651 RepID=UPI0026023300|nr:2OG-Fe(II) oxygenase family protein [uncultured Tateyamaria sp.]